MKYVLDQYDYTHYSIKSMTDEECVKEVNRINAPHNLERVIEVYDLTMDLEMQLAEHRAWHPPDGAVGQR